MFLSAMFVFQSDNAEISKSAFGPSAHSLMKPVQPDRPMRFRLNIIYNRFRMKSSCPLCWGILSSRTSEKHPLYGQIICSRTDIDGIGWPGVVGK